MSYSPSPGDWPPEPHPHPPSAPPQWPPPAEQPEHQRPFEPIPAGISPLNSARPPSEDAAPADAPQPTPPPPRHHRRARGIIGGIAALFLLAGVSAFGTVFFARTDGGSVDDGHEPQSSPSISDSASPTDEPTHSGQELPADQATAGDCLDNPDDVTDTRIVDCADSRAAAEVVARADDPDAEDTQKAAAAECEDTGSDYTIYLLDEDAGSGRFVLCVKEL